MGMKEAIPLLRQEIAAVLSDYNQGKLAQVKDIEATIQSARELEALFSLEEILVNNLWSLKTNIKAIKEHLNSKIEKQATEDEAEKARLEYMVKLLSLQVKNEPALRVARGIMKILEATEAESKSFIVKMVGKIIPNIADKIKARLGVKPVLEKAIASYLKKKEEGESELQEAVVTDSEAVSGRERDDLAAQVQHLKAVYETAKPLLQAQSEKEKELRAKCLAGIQALLKKSANDCEKNLNALDLQLAELDAKFLADFNLDPLLMVPQLEAATLSQKAASLVKAGKKLAEFEASLKKLGEEQAFLKVAQGDFVEALPSLVKMNETQKRLELKLASLLELKAKIETAVTEKTAILSKARQSYADKLKVNLNVYVESRALTYSRRDSISRFFARILNWFGFGYKTEKQKREEYVKDQLLPRLDNYVKEGEPVAKEMTEVFQTGLRFFSPRAKKDHSAYQQSMHCLLETAADELKAVNQSLSPRR
jgi:hypothetical protein